VNAPEGFIGRYRGLRVCARHLTADDADSPKRTRVVIAAILPGFYWTGNTRMNCWPGHRPGAGTPYVPIIFNACMVTGHLPLMADFSQADSGWYLAVYWMPLNVDACQLPAW